MAVTKARDVAYVRFGAPDLDAMKSFLLDFGLSEAGEADDGVLRMRGTGPLPFLHETEQGEPGLRALGLLAGSVADIETLAREANADVEDAPGPGGGKLVRLRDPNDFQVEVIAGQEPAAQRPHGTRAPWNIIGSAGRPGEAKRVAAGPASVVRLGHVVLVVDDMAATLDWWKAHFGLLVSDEVRAPNGDLAAVFIRCDRGAEPTDHHSLNFASVPGKSAGFHHAAFEVADLDDLMAGHEHLKQAGYRHDWGVGRHILGSQVFDYWKDPWGHRVEHWTDGDLFAADVPTSVTDLPTMLGRQWGPAAPADFV